ncbi:MAG: hypothetical protein HZB18_13955 [Chloroflexi bacterium]|nr:hypothetical protein [Chloroflexota bacterium]
MSTDTALIEKREELKRRLAAGEYKTLVDIFLGWFERLLRRITRRSKPLSLWVVTIVLCIIIELINISGIYIAGDWVAVRKGSEFYGLGYKIGFLITMSTGILVIIGTIVFNQYIGRLLALWRDDILNKTNTTISLNDFEDWLKTTCSWRLHLFTTLIFTILYMPYLLSTISVLFGMDIGYGILFALVVGVIFASSMLYQLLMVILLSARLRRYDLELFSSDPGSSEIISRLSGELGFFIYFFAIFAAFLTLVTSQMGGLSPFGFVLVLFFWLPITVLFILNQTSLSSIIRRAKWKTLNEIQTMVEKLQEGNNYSDKETMEAINRLINYHNQVKATRNSAIDLGTTLNFINSLLLPLIAFILGNLDLVTSLFTNKP